MMFSARGRLLTPGTAVALGLIVLLAAVLRIALLRYAPAFMLLADSTDYFSAANHLATEGTFPLPLKRAPLYPAFLAGVIHWVGVSGEAAVLVQHLIGLGTVVLVYLIGAVVFGRTVGLVAAFGAAVNGSLLLMEHTINAEAIFTPLLLIALLLCLMALRPAAGEGASTSSRPSATGAWLLLGVGLTVGLAALSRTAAQAILPLLLGAALLRPASWRARLGGAALLGLGYVLVVTPWMARNAAIHGLPAITAGSGDSLIARVHRHDPGFDFSDHGSPDPDSPAWRARNRVYELAATIAGGQSVREAVQADLGLTPAQADAVARDAVLHVLRQQPGYYVQSTLSMFWRVLLGIERPIEEYWSRRVTAQFAADQGMVVLLTNIYRDGNLEPLLITLFLIGCGACLIGWRRGLAVLPLIVCTQLLLYAALDGPLPRYRYPFQPLITLLAAGGLGTLVSLAAHLLGPRARSLGSALRTRRAG